MNAQTRWPAACLHSARTSVPLRPVLVLIGFTAVIAQIVLMRELIVVFSGNEISLGLMLAGWLLWTAFGSSLLGRLGAGLEHPRRLVAALEVLVGLALPATILAIRSSKGLFQPVPGELLGPGPALLTSFASLSLFCAASGWLFAAGSRLYAGEVRVSSAEATGSVYLLEAAGSGAGGILASLVLIRYLDAFEIAALLAFLNLLAAACLALDAGWFRRAAGLLLTGLFVFLVFPLACGRLEELSLARFWRGFEIVATRNSIYGNLAVIGTEGSASLYENGLVVFNVPDLAAAEETVHFALLQHPSPRSLLLIGGGVNGSLAQALQHPTLERVDYVELDPATLELAREHFPAEWAPVREDPRVRVHNADGRLFLKTTPARFDVIIVNLPDPQTAQLNRFYTLEFFREAAGKLTANGVLSFRLSSSENYISPQLAAFLRCIHATLRAVFPEVITIPGGTVHFFAAARPGILVPDSDGLLARLRSRSLETVYVREYYLPFRMMPDRVQALGTLIQQRPETPINRDFAPIAYYYNVALWSTRFDSGYRRLFEAAGGVSFGRITGAAGLLVFTLAVLMGRLPARKRRPRFAAAFCLGAMGFTMIGLQIVLLLGFQATYGYVYHQLAIVIAAFMVGMALGGWRGVRRAAASAGRPFEPREMHVLAGLQFIAAASALLVYALFEGFARASSPAGLFLVSHGAFPALALLSGLLGGFQFPLASRVYFFGSARPFSSLGTPYAVDLLGACLGAMLFSVYLIPVFGFLKTALLAAVVNLAPALLAATSTSGSRPPAN